MNHEGIKAIIDFMLNTEHCISPVSAGGGGIYYIWWKKPSEWIEILCNWAVATGRTGQVESTYAICSCEDGSNGDNVLNKMPENVLKYILVSADIASSTKRIEVIHDSSTTTQNDISTVVGIKFLF